MIDEKHRRGQPVSSGGRGPARLALVLSEELAKLGPGIDVALLRDGLQRALSNAEVHIVPRLASRLREISRVVAASGAQVLVLGLVPGECSTREIQAEARRAGLDPLGVAVANLDVRAVVPSTRTLATERAKLLLVAAAAKARAFPGSRPEHLKARLSVAVNRRALFTLSAQECRPVPAVRPSRCAASRGCHGCTSVCPLGAVRLKGGRPEIDKSLCEGCGLCVSACQWEAIDYPGHSAAELDAQIQALLDPALDGLEPRAVLFFCERDSAALEAAVEYPSNWLPVVVSCVGMLSPALFLRTLALGAAAVGVVPCGERCSFGQDAIVGQRVSFCRELLGLLGDSPERVRLCPQEGTGWEVPAALGAPPRARVATAASSDPRAAVAAVLSIRRVHEAPVDLVLTHSASPFGVVELDSGRCTSCEACAAVCPTGALAVEHRGVDDLRSQRDERAVSFDATLCNACGFCVARCPEARKGVLRLHRRVDLSRLEGGRQVVCHDERPRCVNCGAPIAPTAMMARLRELLGEQHGAIASMTTRYCPQCRGAALLQSGRPR